MKTVQWDNSLPIWRARQFLIGNVGWRRILQDMGAMVLAQTFGAGSGNVARVARWTQGRQEVWRIAHIALSWNLSGGAEIWSTVVMTADPAVSWSCSLRGCRCGISRQRCKAWLDILGALRRAGVQSPPDRRAIRAFVYRIVGPTGRCRVRPNAPERRSARGVWSQRLVRREADRVREGAGRTGGRHLAPEGAEPLPSLAQDEAPAPPWRSSVSATHGKDPTQCAAWQ